MKHLTLTCLALTLISFAACHRNTRRDNADKVENSVNKAGDKAEDAVENAGDKVEDATDKK